MLTRDENLEGLARLNAEWVEQAMARTPHQRVILDMESSESPVHGQQEGAAHNAHFECVCYHPLFCFNQFGDREGPGLRLGNVHSADRWREVLQPAVERYTRTGVRVPANDVLQRHIRHLLKRPVGRPPKKPVVWYHDFNIGE